MSSTGRRTTWTRSSPRTARSTSRSTRAFLDIGAAGRALSLHLHGRRPDTPGADPQWEATGNPLEVQFSNGASGGVSWEWDFDNDGTVDSTEADPLHTYEADGPHEVTLTVTYADEQTDSKTITVNPQGDDTAPPTTTVQLNGADPVPSYDGPVEVTLTADDAGGTGVEVTRYSVDGGAFTDYAAPFTVSGDGEHTVEYRSRDAGGNVEETQSVTFTITTPGGGEDCLPQSDEFDGTELDPKWDVLREVAEDPPVVADGSVTLPLRQGDFIANDPLAENVLLQDAPGGEWTATTALDIGDINGPGEQAGLVIWKSESPNTFSKIVFIQASRATASSSTSSPRTATSTRRSRRASLRPGRAADQRHGAPARPLRRRLGDRRVLR